jgi:hypothetical protein
LVDSAQQQVSEQGIKHLFVFGIRMFQALQTYGIKRSLSNIPILGA